jgi:hypothetical protein
MTTRVTPAFVTDVILSLSKDLRWAEPRSFGKLRMTWNWGLPFNGNSG